MAIKKLYKKTRKTLTKIIAGSACIGMLACCSGEILPGEFTTIDSYGTGGGHFEEARRKLHNRYGDSIRVGKDHDFDSDNKNDLYIIAKNGTVFYTKSRRVYDGNESESQRRWFKGSHMDSYGPKFSQRTDK